VTEIVRDPGGQAFELRPPRSNDFFVKPHLGMRAMLDRIHSVAGVFDNRENHEAITRALVDVGLWTLGRERALDFDEAQALLRQALADGALCLVPYVRSLRPVCDLLDLEPEPLIDEASEALAAEEPAAAVEEPWPGDAAAQAQVLLEASANATPFCEVCEKARRAS
jgi:hypothetical protein